MLARICIAVLVIIVSVNADRVCKTKDGVPDATLGGILDYVCSTLDCSPINPGGDHFTPNTVRAHADWAVNAFYAKHRDDTPSSWFQACFFTGSAEIDPPFANLLFLVAKDSGSSPALSHTTKYPSGVGVSDVISVGGQVAYVSSPLSLTFNRSRTATIFSLWAAGEGALDVLNATIFYDFNGNGTVDRTESYKNWNELVAPQFAEYTQGAGLATVEGGDFADFSNGTVTLLVQSPGGQTPSILLQSTKEFPSLMILPYDP